MLTCCCAQLGSCVLLHFRIEFSVWRLMLSVVDFVEWLNCAQWPHQFLVMRMIGKAQQSHVSENSWCHVLCLHVRILSWNDRKITTTLFLRNLSSLSWVIGNPEQSHCLRKLLMSDVMFLHNFQVNKQKQKNYYKTGHSLTWYCDIPFCVRLDNMHDSEKDKTTQVGPGPGPALTCSSHDNPYKSKFHMIQLWISNV
jgi:hypothetical protein